MTPAVRIAMMIAVCMVALVAATDVWACPTCKDGIAGNDPVSQATAAGYFYSILFMMAMPFVIIGTFGSAAYLSIRRAREAQSSQPNAVLEELF
jgi:uncharacterized paraquat-inducible protein A